ncbi:MAG: hypothetical protein M1434_09440 [Chloroflexi bacterium]|nr:hypothetical protein [Chloroflexota bacterium]MCL5274947.1 hypothetical protein [Chloroflexota bacterium]
MTYGNEYELARLAFREWNEKFNNLYVPPTEKQPNVLQRLLAALRSSREVRAENRKAVTRGQNAQTGAVAK